jgi:8-oxo-dGTP pyrophosphatase MutT (NUDIX family)
MKLVNDISESDIEKRLAASTNDPYLDPNSEILVAGKPRLAAVLIPLLMNKGSWEILFIRRSSAEADHHSGQVAFPGGRMEPEDASPEKTALREAQEEIALGPDQVRILGNLEYMVTISNYQVTPIVGVIPWPISLKPAPTEVQRIFTIPLEWLADPANYELRQREIPGGSNNGTHPVYYYKHFDNELLWGVSARITMSFLRALGLK